MIKSMRLGDICEVRSGDSAPQSDADFSNEGMPFIRAGSLPKLLAGLDESELEKISESVGRSRKMYVYPPNTILFAKSGMSSTKGHIYRTKGEAHVVSHLAALNCTDEIDASFLTHWLRKNSPARLIANEAYPSIRLSDIKSEIISLPPIAEQERIAAILDKADELRTKRKEAIAELDKLQQSVFLDMFGDPVTNPKGWEVLDGGELASRITVGIVVKPASYYRETGVPALRSLNIRENRIDETSLVFVSHEDNISRLKKTQIYSGDLVLVRSGQPGTAAVVPEHLNGINAIDILILTPALSLVTPEYLCRYFNSAGGRRMVLGAQRGQIQKHLNVSALKSAKIPVPHIALQKEFTAFIQSSEKQKNAQKAHAEELDKLFASLQSKAFKGEL